MKKILIDARISANDGIGRYTREMIKAINLFPQYSFSYLIRNKDFFASSLKIYEDSSKSYSMDELVNFEKAIKKDKPDIIHCFDYRTPLYLNKEKIIVTIHDIFRFIDESLCYTDEDFQKKVGKKLYKECQKLISLYCKPNNYLKDVSYYSLHHQYYCYLLSHAINLANSLIVPSKTIKNDILDNFSVTENKIHVIYHGLNHINYSGKIDLFIKNKFFLYVGQNRPHKNLNLLIKAFKQYGQKNNNSSIELVLVGKDFPKDCFLGKNIICMGEKSDEELVYMLKNAIALVHIPRFEGFGFTPAEALYWDCPVIASDIPTLREILGTSAIFINLENTEELIQAFEHVYKNSIKSPFLLRNRKWKDNIQEVYNLYNLI